MASAFDVSSALGLAARPSGLREIDELVRDPDASGHVVVQAPAAVLDAVTRHIDRRARAIARPLIKVDGTLADDPWRELAARFPALQGGDPLALAQAIVDRAGATLMLVREGAPTTFGRAVADELGRILRASAPILAPAREPAAPTQAPPRCLLLVLSETSESPPPSIAPVVLPVWPAARLIEVDPELSSDDLALWWEAVARDTAQRGVPGLDRLDALDAWWSAARVTPLDQRAPAIPLGAEAARLLARLALSQRSWPASQIHRLGKAAAAEELVRAGALALDPNGRVVAGPLLSDVTLDAAPADASDIGAVAAALSSLPDPWAAARAGELHASLGAYDRAEEAAIRAVSAAVDATARADFWHRWERTLATLPEEEAVPRLLRSADLALRIGDIDRALTLAGAALAKRPDTFATLLMLGRANVARGDLPTAGYWLGKALAGAASAEQRSRVEVELAEVRHMEGDIDGARRFATSALDAIVGAPGEAAASTRLHARNLLGKILLATSAWSEAEEHFAADACEAALSSDMMAELRARLNRSIALLSSGRLDEARAMLSAILAEGESRGELRAVAYALTNLATIAILKREYAEALRLSERAFDARRRLGDKVSLALLICNLAELKLQLGQIAEAEQALAFGRKACGPGMPGARASQFAFTAALLHLERGRTVEASAELRTALGTARGSGNGSLLAECHRLAARVALEDGDLVAAEAALEQAAALADSPRERAWVALLEAQRARAAGEPFGEAAVQALERARVADDPELVREAHLIAHHAAALASQPRAARTHLDAAAAVRDRIAEALPEDLRRRYLARRDLAELARIESTFDVDASGVAHPAAGPRAGGAHAVAGPGADAGERPALVSIGLSTGSPILLPAREPASPILPPASMPANRVGPRSGGEAPRRMVGRAPAMLALATAITKVGASDATVLVHGESGTGKELVAEAIHEASPRRAGPLVKVNCAALVETLLLSELFGHEKGSFTGAAARRRGRFEAAEGGTLFLDEIGDISPRTQVALLRVLQEKTFERVGGVTSIRANVRIVCATHRDLAAMVARGEFREDLYYRLRGVVLEVPALRSRLTDLPLITAAILERIAVDRGSAPRRLSAPALEALARHPWPGNVRELENALRAAALFAEGDVIELADFTANVTSLHGLAVPSASQPVVVAAPSVDAIETDGTQDACEVAPMTQPSRSARPQDLAAHSGDVGSSGSSSDCATDVAYAAVRGGVSLADLKRDIERECIARALAETSGNITRAAGLLGMKRPRLSQLVKQYGFGGAGSAVDVDAESEDGE